MAIVAPQMTIDVDREPKRDGTYYIPTSSWRHIFYLYKFATKAETVISAEHNCTLEFQMVTRKSLPSF